MVGKLVSSRRTFWSKHPLYPDLRSPGGMRWVCLAFSASSALRRAIASFWERGGLVTCLNSRSRAGATFNELRIRLFCFLRNAVLCWPDHNRRKAPVACPSTHSLKQNHDTRGL